MDYSPWTSLNISPRFVLAHIDMITPPVADRKWLRCSGMLSEVLKHGGLVPWEVDKLEAGFEFPG